MVHFWKNPLLCLLVGITLVLLTGCGSQETHHLSDEQIAYFDKIEQAIKKYAGADDIASLHGKVDDIIPGKATIAWFVADGKIQLETSYTTDNGVTIKEVVTYAPGDYVTGTVTTDWSPLDTIPRDPRCHQFSAGFVPRTKNIMNAVLTNSQDHEQVFSEYYGEPGPNFNPNRNGNKEKHL